MNVHEAFESFTTGCARFTGRPAMFLVCLVLAAFGIAALALGNDRLVADASIIISMVTLLLLPVLQATQNRDGAALHAKLDELIKTDSAARDALIGLERKGEKEIVELRPDEESD